MSALVLIANGTEEIEFTVVYDTLVRAGIRCTSAYVPGPADDSSDSNHATNLKPPLVTCSRGVVIHPDAVLNPEIHGPDEFNALVIPGGATGADTLSRSSHVQHLVRQFLARERIVGMICAGSLAALAADLPAQMVLTSHPSVRTTLEQKFIYSEDSVVICGTLITSRGPGTAFPFALTLVELLCGKDKRAEIQAPMVFPPGTPF